MGFGRVSTADGLPLVHVHGDDRHAASVANQQTCVVTDYHGTTRLDCDRSAEPRWDGVRLPFGTRHGSLARWASVFPRFGHSTRPMLWVAAGRTWPRDRRHVPTRQAPAVSGGTHHVARCGSRC